MSEQPIQFSHAPDGRPLFRRDHKKTDGRIIRLYGYRPPDQPPLNDGLDAAPGASHLRFHPLRGEWNIYAAARQDRTFQPSAANNPLAPAQPGAPATEIPFDTFELAVFENRFPSLSRRDGSKGTEGHAADIAPANGHCDVVVYTPEDTGSLATLSQARRVLLVKAWIDRYQALFDQGFDTVLPFENRGQEVGVTLSHPHGQIYAFDMTPPVQKAAADGFANGFDLSRALASWQDDYQIDAQGGVTAFAPPFARFPYETWLAPTQRRRGPWAFTAEEIEGFAHLLGGMTARYDKLFGRACPYMLSLHAAPKSADDTFHFTAQFYPLLRSPDKVKYLASVEQATSIFTVDIMPERTASEMRDL
ncbi:MAG: galactose-1-phosphate uridylyltransferase [Pseudomonadota bacterium]